jgi:suppressor of ftsI
MASSRRGFVIGCGAVAASAVFGGQLGRGKAAPFTTPLPIPRLIDVAATRHTVNLKATSGRHAFIAGKPARTYGTRHRSSDLSSACAAATNGNGRRESSRCRHDGALAWPSGARLPRWRAAAAHSGGRTLASGVEDDQPAATLWFHPHPHGDTARNWLTRATRTRLDPTTAFALR